MLNSIPMMPKRHYLLPGSHSQLAFALIVFSAAVVSGQASRELRKSTAPISPAVMLRIVQAEDTRRWDSELQTLLADKSAPVRRRAALAAGRIGDDHAVGSLVSLLQKDSDETVRAMAAFALGEIESPSAADALLSELREEHEPVAVRARAVEALGKIAAALPTSEEAKAKPLRTAILSVLEFEAGRRSAPDDLVILLGLTAALRARPEGVGKVIVRFLNYSDQRVRTDAANTLARLKLGEGNSELRKVLTADPNPVMRANAARVLGATEDKTSLASLLDRALKDADLRVRVSAIRALGSLKDPDAATPLLQRGEELYAVYHQRRERRLARPTEINEILEIATVLGRLLPGSNDKRTIEWLQKLGHEAPEVDIAFARIAPAAYLDEFSCCPDPPERPLDVRYGGSGIAQGLGELASLPNALIKAQAGLALRQGLCTPAVDAPECARAEQSALPDYLRAYAAFKPNDIATLLAKQLTDSDVIVRATAAELLGELPPAVATESALTSALRLELPRVAKGELNDGVLGLLDSLAKQKSSSANVAIKTTLDAADYLIRVRAVALLKANGAGDFSQQIGAAQTRNTTADYTRALARVGRRVRATVRTSKGSFVIELLPDEAPLTVDNFVMLARKGFFNGQFIPRVVPNFVIQAGDPRGDGNGGPGYQIRCEMNQLEYERGAVGMALSGKDTGGSQWFVTHSPQPHLDGGYTVFGRVISGMEVVDNIVRGDIIRTITIGEGAGRPAAVAKPK